MQYNIIMVYINDNVIASLKTKSKPYICSVLYYYTTVGL